MSCSRDPTDTHIESFKQFENSVHRIVHVAGLLLPTIAEIYQRIGRVGLQAARDLSVCRVLIIAYCGLTEVLGST